MLRIILFYAISRSKQVKEKAEVNKGSVLAEDGSDPPLDKQFIMFRLVFELNFRIFE